MFCVHACLGSFGAITRVGKGLTVHPVDFLTDDARVRMSLHFLMALKGSLVTTRWALYEWRQPAERGKGNSLKREREGPNGFQMALGGHLEKGEMVDIPGAFIDKQRVCAECLGQGNWYTLLRAGFRASFWSSRGAFCVGSKFPVRLQSLANLKKTLA